MKRFSYEIFDPLCQHSKIHKNTFLLATIFLGQIRLNNVLKTDRKSTNLRQLRQTHASIANDSLDAKKTAKNDVIIARRTMKITS